MLSGCSKPKNGITPVEAKPIQTITTQKGGFHTIRAVTGITEPIHDIILSAQISGKVEYQPFSIGDKIEVDQVLAKIEQEMALAQYNAAKANFNAAKINYNSIKTLYEKKLASRQQWETTKQQYEAAKSNFEIAEIQVKNTKLSSPVNGTVAQIYVDQNEFIAAGMPVIRVVDISKIKIMIGVIGEDLPNIRTGEIVDITLSAYPDTTFKGKISRISEAAEQKSRTFPVEILIENPSSRIKAGMLCQIKFINKRLNNVVIIPVDSILEGKDKTVFTVENGKAVQQLITILAIQEDQAAVQGLMENKQLITVGHKDLVNGQVIRVIEKAPAQSML
ncbi:efflux RND transporter periplasmic adaptor subunit [Thermoproteota archaeon]